MHHPSLKAVLFDLDGTLLDTAPDLAVALNALLKQHHRPTLPFDAIRPVASHGSKGLIKLGFQIDDDDKTFPQLIEEFLALYGQKLYQQTTLFAGIEPLLNYLTTNKLHWGVVTNKPARFTEPLLKHLGLLSRTTCVVSGDTLSKRKPDPEPLLHACDLLSCQPHECFYIGDAERDIQAGKSAGMHTLVALYGYIATTDHPATWGADGMIEHPDEIIAWLTKV